MHLSGPACHHSEDVCTMTSSSVFAVRQATWEPWFSQWCTSTRWVPGQPRCVWPGEARKPSVMMSTAVAMCHFKHEGRWKAMFKILFVLRKFVYVLTWSHLCLWFENDRKKFPFLRTLFGGTFLLESWLCKKQNAEVDEATSRHCWSGVASTQVANYTLETPSARKNVVCVLFISWGGGKE